MPLLKRKAYQLAPRPADLRPDEEVFHVRFTGECFRRYNEYIRRIKLYRQRIWTCRVTGKTNLTYEEALVSENKAAAKVQQFPQEYIAPVLNMVQFSQDRLDLLVDKIHKAFADRYAAGEEVLANYEGEAYKCKVVAEVVPGKKYRVGWVSEVEGRPFIRESVEDVSNLTRKRPTLTRVMLKNFIRDSASVGNIHNIMWVVQPKLAKRHGIPTEPPEHLREVYNQVHALSDNRRAAQAREKAQAQAQAKAKAEQHDQRIKQEAAEAPIRYPIEDLDVQPGPDDSEFTVRPSPSKDFYVREESVGDLLMVWDFLMCFGKVLRLSPFNLDDWERAIVFTDDEVPLLSEAHTCLLSTLFDDPDFKEELTRQKRHTKVSMETWMANTADFIEATSNREVWHCLPYLQPGKYWSLDSRWKLAILRSLCDATINADRIRVQLEENAQLYREAKVQLRQLLIEDRKRERVEVMTKKQLESARDEQTSTPSTAEEEAHETQYKGNGVENGPAASVLRANGLHKSESAASIATASSDANEDETEGVSKTKMRQARLAKQQALRQAEEAQRKRKLEAERELQESKRRAYQTALAERRKQEEQAETARRKIEACERELERVTVRTSPLGLDRSFNSYWFFPREGRLFVEEPESRGWGYYSSKEQLDSLSGSLNTKGIREQALQKKLEKNYIRLSHAMVKRARDIAQRIGCEESSVRRSLRVKSTPRQETFFAYVNKYAS